MNGGKGEKEENEEKEEKVKNRAVRHGVLASIFGVMRLACFMNLKNLRLARHSKILAHSLVRKGRRTRMKNIKRSKGMNKMKRKKGRKRIKSE